MAEKRSAHTRTRERGRYLEETRERIIRQEQAIEHLAAKGHSTALAKKRLAALRQAFNALLRRRKGEAEEGSVPSTTIPGQLGLAEQKGQPGSQAP